MENKVMDINIEQVYSDISSIIMSALYKKHRRHSDTKSDALI